MDGNLHNLYIWESSQLRFVQVLPITKNHPRFFSHEIRINNDLITIDSIHKRMLLPSNIYFFGTLDFFSFSIEHSAKAFKIYKHINLEHIFKL